MLSRLPSLLRDVVGNRSGARLLPRFLTYTVTYTCNARCIMCDSWKIPSPNDLTLAELEGVFRQLPRMDAVRLTGGEPFVRKDLLDIAHLVQDVLKPAFLHITTNGFLTDRILKFVEERRRDVPLAVLVSIDGLKEKHNHVRGRDTAWDSAIKTVRELAARRRSHRLTVAVNQTIVDAEGADHFKLLREELRPLGVHNQMVMAYDVSATYSTERDIDVAPTQMGSFSTFGDFSEERLRALFAAVEESLEDLPAAERLAKRYYLRGIASRLLRGEGSPNPGCVALNSHMRLFPNGDIPTCQFNSKVVGNLRKNTFREVWFGERAGEQRDWVKKCPGCWAECEVLPSAIYSGDLLREAARFGSVVPKDAVATAPQPATEPAAER